MDINTELIESIFSMSRLMRDQMSCDLSMTHISMLQLQALIFIKKHPHCQMSDIAGEFNIELPSATSLINKLVKAKLVQREADEKDRRLVRVALTQSGGKLLEEGMKMKTKKIEQMLSYLTEKEKEDLLRITKTIITNMEEQHEK